MQASLALALLALLALLVLLELPAQPPLSPALPAAVKVSKALRNEQAVNCPMAGYESVSPEPGTALASQG